MICRFSCISLVSIAALSGCAPTSGPTLRLVTWNVHGCQAGVDKIAAELQRLEPDIVCLQEVSCGLLDSSETRSAERIAKLLGMHYVSTPAPVPGTKEEQMAIYARGKLEDVEFLEAGTKRRYGITAELELRHDIDLRIVCVHLTSNAPFLDFGRFLVTGGRRLREVGDLTARLQRWDDDDGLILAGDFNATPAMLEHAGVRGHMRWAASFQPTFPSERPVLELDHVFFEGPLELGRLSVEPTEASDHRPLVADIHLTHVLALSPFSGPSLFEDETDEKADDEADD